jgi:single-strand DNA-binding protein
MSFASTQVTVVGRVVSDVETRVTPGGDKVANFRIACQERHYDKAKDLWMDGDRMVVAIACWRNMADHAEASLHQGDQVIARGRLKLREYKTDGERRTTLEVDAKSLGPDLALHTVSVNRPNWSVSPNQQPLLTVNPTPPDSETPRPEDPETQQAQEEVVKAA